MDNAQSNIGPLSSGDNNTANQQPNPVSDVPVATQSDDTNPQHNPSSSNQPPDPVAMQSGGISNYLNNQKPDNNFVIPAGPASKSAGGKRIVTILGVLLLVGSVAAGVFLVQQQQEIREKASSGSVCTQDPECILLEDPGNSGAFTAPKHIDYVDITNKSEFRFGRGDTNDGCYKVSISGYDLNWSRIGSGPDCKDVSNIQVKLKKGEEKPTSSPTPGNPEFMRICHKPGDSSPYPWQAIEIEVVAWDNHQIHGDFLWEGPENIWPPDPGLSDPTGITEADKWCDKGTTSTPTPTPPSETSASCQELKVYTTDWDIINQADLASLSAGSVVRFAVAGTTLSGTIDKARFTINGELMPEVITKKPGTEEFYYEYALPTGVESYSVNAELHHSDLGWF